MARSSCHLSIACLALTAGAILGCHAPLNLSTSHSLQRINSSTLRNSKSCSDNASPQNIANIHSISSHLNLRLRGGAEADSYERYVYDDRPRRRHHPQSSHRDRRDTAARGDIPNFRDARAQRSNDFSVNEQRRRTADDGRRIRRNDDDRWDSEDRSRYSNFTPNSNTRRRDKPAAQTKKSWFSSKKNQERSDEEPTQQQQPPPPPPPNAFANYNPAESDRVPINYMFPSAEVAASERIREEKSTDSDPMGGPDLPIEDIDGRHMRVDDSGERKRRRSVADDERYASPRRDAVTMYMSTTMGSMKVRLGSIIVGAALGSFAGKSLMNDALKMSVIMGSMLFLAGFLRNDYGELSRALGLALLLTLQRTKSVRKEYPTIVHLKAMIRQGPRKPFPPIEEGSSPWRYEPIYEDDPEFKMTYALLAMALVGSFCGGNVPLLPQWMGGIIGAVLFASFTSGSNARGDLGRTMGMRVVGIFQLVLKINTELRILGKAATVGGLIFDKIMIMDRKHRIKDKIVAICRWGYDKVSNTAAEMQSDLNDGRERKQNEGSRNRKFREETRDDRD